AAARHVGVTPEVACEALSEFQGVKRRMEQIASVNGIRVYDDFAHHPTAIATTLSGLRKRVGDEKIIAVIEPRSNTMKLGVHKNQLAESVIDADKVFWFQPDNIEWSLQDVVDRSTVPSEVVHSIDRLLLRTLEHAGDNGNVVIMSNGGFCGFHRRLVDLLEEKARG
ncbi:MAG: UDP-N-acetylmuramate:L-alanyl-gamma-D-glutamyl-meso-diaminopimelate ligase, partial [Gammaproteobacteria bacterium]